MSYERQRDSEGNVHLGPREARENELVNSPKRELTYSPEFKRFINDNPGALKSFLKLQTQISEAWGSTMPRNLIFKDGTLKIEIMSEYTRDYMEVNIGNKKFFVKRSPGAGSYDSSGVDEIRSLQTVKSQLKGHLEFEVIDYQLGYQDNARTTYFVSKWVNHKSALFYINTWNTKSLSDNKYQHKLDELLTKIQTLQSLLSKDFYDVGPHNMFYDPKRGVLTVFDVHDKRK